MTKKYITRSDGQIYLIRYSLFSCPWFAIKLHNIVRDDDICMHDHPWTYISIILKGGYVEQKVASEKEIDVNLKKGLPNEKGEYSYKGHRLLSQYTPGDYLFYTKQIKHPGNILYRPAKTIHRLEIFQPCWTLVITFKKIREWGFITKRGWIKWFEYKSTNNCE